MSTTAVQPIVRILGISGSLQTASNNTKLLHAARGLARPGVRFEVWSGLAAVPPFNEDDEDEPAEPVHTLRDTIAAADAVLIATPEYNNSVPGQLKNAVDWASRPYGHGAAREADCRGRCQPEPLRCRLGPGGAAQVAGQRGSQRPGP